MGKDKNDPFAALFAEAVEAVEGINQENSAKNNIDLDDLDIEIEIVDSESLDAAVSDQDTINPETSDLLDDGIEIEIVVDDDSSEQDHMTSTETNEISESDLQLDIDVEFLTPDSNGDPDSSPNLEETSTTIEELKHQIEDLQSKYTKAKKIAQKRKQISQEQEQKINALRMELFQSKGFELGLQQRDDLVLEL